RWRRRQVVAEVVELVSDVVQPRYGRLRGCARIGGHGLELVLEIAHAMGHVVETAAVAGCGILRARASAAVSRRGGSRGGGGCRLFAARRCCGGRVGGGMWCQRGSSRW